MLAPFATLAFLLVLWLVAAVGMEIFSRSSRRIAAALRREAPTIASQILVKARSNRPAYARTRPLRAQPQLRAAA